MSKKGTKVGKQAPKPGTHARTNTFDHRAVTAQKIKKSIGKRSTGTGGQKPANLMDEIKNF